MARKHRDDDDIDPEDRAQDEPEDADRENAARGDADREGEGREAEEADVERPPRPRTPVLTMVLAILNLVVAPILVVLFFLDYGARYQWSYATFLNRVLAYGLPLADEEAAAPASYYTRPRLRIDSDRLKEAYTKRPKPQGTPSVTEAFQPADTMDEPVAFRIKPSQITAQVQRDLNLEPPVRTLDEEVNRLKEAVPRLMDEAATKFVTDRPSVEKKVQALERILLPLAWNSFVPHPKLDQGINRAGTVDALSKQIKDAAAAGSDQLDRLLKEAVQRRMLADVLAPANIYRPGEKDQLAVEKISELENHSLDTLFGILRLRLDAAATKGDDVEKRHEIAFLMVALARVKVPESKELLLSKGEDRAQIICGLYEFAQAAANYVRTLHVLENRVLNAIEVDREGYVVASGRTPAFVEEHAGEIERLRKLAAEIEFTKKRYTTLVGQRDRYKKQYEDRLTLMTEVTKRLVEARKETFKMRSELQELEKELHAANIKLSDAAERNFALEAQIREAEAQLLKGGKKQ
jgi:hypothetical protein